MSTIEDALRAAVRRLQDEKTAIIAERDALRVRVAELELDAQRLGRLGLSDLRRDMVEAAAFVREYYESHRATTEWPSMQKTRDLREEAEAVADAFEQAGGGE